MQRSKSPNRLRNTDCETREGEQDRHHAKEQYRPKGIPRCRVPGIPPQLPKRPRFLAVHIRLQHTQLFRELKVRMREVPRVLAEAHDGEHHHYDVVGVMGALPEQVPDRAFGGVEAGGEGQAEGGFHGAEVLQEVASRWEVRMEVDVRSWSVLRFGRNPPGFVAQEVDVVGFAVLDSIVQADFFGGRGSEQESVGSQKIMEHFVSGIGNRSLVVKGLVLGEMSTEEPGWVLENEELLCSRAES